MGKAKRRSRAFQSGFEVLEKRRLLDAILAADINTAPGYDYSPTELLSVGNLGYFSAHDGINGKELWKTDATNAGTSMVKDIAPGLASSTPSGIVKTADDTLYFSAGNSATGIELWKSDGTESGTVLVKDINPGDASSSPTSITVMGNRVFFLADDGTHGRELWVSDGTTGGTQLVKDLQTGTSGQSSVAYPMAAAGGFIFFTGTDGTHLGLWKSSGAVGDATFIAGDTFGQLAFQLTSFDDRVFFTSQTGALLTSNGTVGNAVSLQSFNSSVAQFVNAGGVLYFNRPSGAGAGAYRIRPGFSTPFAEAITGGISNPTAIGNLGSDLYIAATTAATGSELFRVPGGTTTASLVADVVTGSAGSFPANLTGVGNELFFTTGTTDTGFSLWATQGSGATFLKAISPPGTGRAPTLAANVNGRLLILVDDPIIGQEFWTSDGTAADTKLLRDIYPGTTHSDPIIWASVNGHLLMTAIDAAHGSELWSLDASGNLARLTDIEPGAGGSQPGNVTVIGGLAYFTATSNALGTELYVTDGTPSGTNLVSQIRQGSADGSPGNLIGFGNYLYFQANDGTNGAQVWTLDGSLGGPHMVMNPSVGASAAGFSNPCVVDRILYFTATDAMGTELWATDGTSLGTRRVKDINAGASSSSPSRLIAFNNLLYFVATDAFGAELWRSDGTEAGTFRVTDIRPGSGSPSISGIAAAGNYLYFTADDGTNGAQLWRTDGTGPGTIPLGVPLLGSSASNPSVATALGDRIFFFVRNAAGGHDLWQSAGTPQTTTFVTAITPPGAPAPVTMIMAIGRLFFDADSGHGIQVWSSDGTAAGTAPQGFAEPVDSKRLVEFNGEVYSEATDSVAGLEPWRFTDTWGPFLWKQQVNETGLTAVMLTFNEGVTVDSSKMRLKNLTTGEELSATHIHTAYNAATHSLRIVAGETGFTMPDGNYRLTLPVGSVADISGNVMDNDIVEDFFVLAGDANHDRSVDFSDLVTVAQNYGGNGKTYEQGDFNFDGLVNFADLVVIAQKYGTTMPALAAPMASATASVLEPLRAAPVVFKAPIAKPAPPKKPIPPVFAARRLR